jgi:hypothetical protein
MILKNYTDITSSDLPNIEKPFFALHDVESVLYGRLETKPIQNIREALDRCRRNVFGDDQNAMNELLNQISQGRVLLVNTTQKGPFSPVVRWVEDAKAPLKGRWVPQDLLNVTNMFYLNAAIMSAESGARLDARITDPGEKLPLRKNVSSTRSESDPTPAAADRFTGLKGVPPVSLKDAENRLNNVRKSIKTNGYQPKYTDKELTDMAQHGNVGEERFQARFMEEEHLQNRDTPGITLSGAMGLPMKGTTGKGAKYWSTSFDQIEDADTDPKLLSEKLGLTYNPKSTYALIIVDREKAVPLAGTKSVSATFKNVSEFANTELPDDFPKAFTDAAMTPEFQAKYAKHHAEAVDSGALPDQWSKDVDEFQKYLKTTDLSQAEQKQLATRMRMHDKIGNNCDYVGNGLTKDLNSDSPNQFGAVETLNFERKKINLKQFSDSGAIRIIKGLNPI